MPPATCPRCGREHSEPANVLCAVCLKQLASRGEFLGEIVIHVSPIVRDALALAQSGEDFDEALLRSLKERHPNEGVVLLPSLTQLIATEAQNSGETRAQALQRLAAADPGPEIRLRTSGPSSPIRSTVITQQTITVNGKQYQSLDDVPLPIREAIRSGMPQTKSRRISCSLGLLLALLSTVVAFELSAIIAFRK